MSRKVAKQVASEVLDNLERLPGQKLFEFVDKPSEYDKIIDGKHYNVRINSFVESGDNYRLVVAVSFDTLFSDMFPAATGLTYRYRP